MKDIDKCYGVLGVACLISIIVMGQVVEPSLDKEYVGGVSVFGFVAESKEVTYNTLTGVLDLRADYGGVILEYVKPLSASVSSKMDSVKVIRFTSDGMVCYDKICERINPDYLHITGDMIDVPSVECKHQWVKERFEDERVIATWEVCRVCGLEQNHKLEMK